MKIQRKEQTKNRIAKSDGYFQEKNISNCNVRSYKMINFSKFVRSKTGKYMMSILLGLGLATIFRAACNGTDCSRQNAPPLEEIDNNIYKFDDKCYK